MLTYRATKTEGTKMKDKNKTEVMETYKVCCNDGGEQVCVFKSSTQEGVTRWIDLILEKSTRGAFSLMTELNDIQVSCNDDEMERFPSKFSMPLKIVNLVLQPYGFHICSVVERGQSLS